MEPSEIKVNRSGVRVTKCAMCGKTIESEGEAMWHTEGVALCERHDSEFRRVGSIQLDLRRYVEGIGVSGNS